MGRNARAVESEHENAHGRQPVFGFHDFKPKRRSALAVLASARRFGSSPRAVAKNTARWATCAGSFLFPRCGERYGESVSKSSLSCGVFLAASSKAPAFLNVTLQVKEI